MTGAASLPVHGGVGAGSCEVAALDRVGARAGLGGACWIHRFPGANSLSARAKRPRRAAHLDNVFS